MKKSLQQPIYLELSSDSAIYSVSGNLKVTVWKKEVPIYD
jgi:hypothetical protein